MKIILFAFGRMKTAGMADSALYYQRLLEPWTSLELVQLDPVAIASKSVTGRMAVQMKEEGILMEKYNRILPQGAPFYLLDESGKPKSTQSWVELVKSWEMEGRSAVGLALGGSLGFSDSLKKQSAGIISLGAHTMSHELARVVLLEQIYRTFSLLNGHPYHNA